MRFGIRLNGFDKRPTDWRHRSRRGHRVLPLLFQKPTRAGFSLQLGNVDVQIHAVYAFHFQRHMRTQDFSQ